MLRWNPFIEIRRFHRGNTLYNFLGRCFDYRFIPLLKTPALKVCLNVWNRRFSMTILKELITGFNHFSNIFWIIHVTLLIYIYLYLYLYNLNNLYNNISEIVSNVKLETIRIEQYWSQLKSMMVVINQWTTQRCWDLWTKIKEYFFLWNRNLSETLYVTLHLSWQRSYKETVQ